MERKLDPRRVYAYLQTVPRGNVVTYGQIARYLGDRRWARAVGNILHANPDGEKIPCYKVVNSAGKLSESYAFGGLVSQKQRLEAEGIPVTGGRVDLRKYQFREDGQEKMIITEVVAALIWDEGKFLICQRPAHKTRGLLWEFVGGKVEPGETKAQALIRECREELDIGLQVGEVFMDVVHTYPDLKVHLTLFHGSIAEGTPRLLEHSALAWITPAQIPQYDFCPADVEILQRITQLYG